MLNEPGLREFLVRFACHCQCFVNLIRFSSRAHIKSRPTSASAHLDSPTFPLHVAVMESGAAEKIPQQTRQTKRSGLPTPTKEKQQNVISNLETNQGRFHWLLNGPRAIIIWWFILMSVAFVSYRVGVSVPC